MAKFAPMKNTRSANPNKKQNYTFTKNQKRKEAVEGACIKAQRKNKSSRFAMYAAAEAL